MATRIQLRHDTENNWTLNKDKVLLDGEVAVIHGNDGKTKLKIGDGETTIENLDVICGFDSLDEIMEYCDKKYTSIFKTISIIRPSDPNHLFLKVDISENMDFSDKITIDSGVDNTLFKGLLVHENNSEWVSQPSDGFSMGFSNQPIVISLSEILEQNEIEVSDETILYIRYYWYWIDDGEQHMSDQYSMVVPTNTEVGANNNDVMSKKEYIELKNEINPLPASINLDDEYGEYYVVSSTKINSIDDALEDGSKVLLKDYEPAKTYSIEMTTKPGIQDGIQLEYYVDYGNGPERLQDEIDDVKFISNSSYMFRISNGSIIIDQYNHQNIFDYLSNKPNSLIRTWDD